ncbi:MAG: gamma-glutamyltransferase, partial [Nitrospinae bacterium]|nr:gamma-glutamyltransferase [Nitrospinota bacterium]
MKIHFKTKRKFLISLLILCLTGVAFVSGYAKSFVTSDERTGRLVSSKNGMVSTQEETATRVGLAILKRGGNAVDAAAAVGFALAVTLPHAGNLGGGGFMLVHVAETGETVAIDYREKAPPRAHKNMFLHDAGQVAEQRSRFTHHSSGV